MSDPNCPGCFINNFQTPEWRKKKYWLARSLGLSASHARVWRDRRLTKLERAYDLVPDTNLRLGPDGRMHLYSVDA
ncbi:hypothetical protein LCGC14_1774070 [marine sediment metagenome]|uniref:Uncharacterized protein n=1 Tax=marine sediment metagenome TaxID=412755 RepID=A0A0F9JX29_9ZZZZ